jgi:hypothetical protein
MHVTDSMHLARPLPLIDASALLLETLKGFNASAMKDAPWAVVVDGHGAVTERKLSDQGIDNKLMQPSVKVVSSTVAGNRRTVVVTRPLAGLFGALLLVLQFPLEEVHIKCCSIPRCWWG